MRAYQRFWTDKRSSLKSEYQAIENKYLDAATSVKLLFKVLCDIANLAGYTPASVEDGEEWVAILNSEENRENVAKL